MIDSLEIVKKMIENIRIDWSNYSVEHIDWRIQEKMAEKVTFVIKEQNQETQINFFTSFVKDFLYSVYYGKWSYSIQTKSYSKIEPFKHNVEIDWDFYNQLSKNNHSNGWWNPGFKIIGNDNSELILEKKNVIIYSTPDLVNSSTNKIGEMVSVYTPSSRIMYEYYTVFGNQVSAYDENSPVFIYFSIQPNVALDFVSTLTRKFNSHEVPFCFYTFYNPYNYGRYDSGVLRISKSDFAFTHDILKDLYEHNHASFYDINPAFTKILAPGINLAEKPDMEFSFAEGFGRNRCYILAKALINASVDNIDINVNYIVEFFLKYGVDLNTPYLNLNSNDIYNSII
jgi:HopA1 effector protein family